MINVKEDWNPKQNLLKEIISKPDRFDEAINLCLKMHSLVHTSEMSNVNSITYEDILWAGLSESVFRLLSGNKNNSIAWNLWHLTRIEDITANILIADSSQIINKKWLKKLNTKVLDTGNAMTKKEVEEFSNEINMNELRNYRIEVGRKTQNIIKNLKPKDLKRKMTQKQLDRIVEEGGVLQAEDSMWLIDFWGRKTVSGIILMPITSHQIVHLNNSLKIKENAKANC